MINKKDYISHYSRLLELYKRQLKQKEFELSVALEFVREKDLSLINDIIEDYPDNIDTWQDEILQDQKK
jgi:hypothetical protein